VGASRPHFGGKESEGETPSGQPAGRRRYQNQRTPVPLYKARLFV
jgi:hypothetical protein